MNPGCGGFIYCWLRALACKLQGVKTWMEQVRFWVRLRFGPSVVIHEEGTNVIFENAFLRLTISLLEGKTSAFHLRSTGESFLARVDSFAFFRTLDGTRHEPVRASFERSSDSEGILQFFFDSEGIEISVACKVYQTHLAFEIVEITSTSGEIPATLELVCIANMKLLGEDFSQTTGSIISGESRISQFALDLYTHVLVREPPPDSCGEPVRPPVSYTLQAQCTDVSQICRLIDWRDPWYGAQVALFAGSKTEWLMLAKEIEKIHALPNPNIERSWVKTHPDLKTSYLFVDVTPDNVDKVICYAKRGGFSYILARNWAKSYGNYEVKEVFASDRYSAKDGLRQVSKCIHKAGLKFGLHVLAGVVSEYDSYFITRQDALARERSDEDCSIAADLLVFNSNYLPDIAREKGRALLLDMAQNFASLYYFIGADMAYLDAVDGAGQSFLTYTKGKMAWFAYSFIVDAYWRALPGNANALFQAAAGNQNYEWHVLARQASTDYAAIGVEAYMDHIKIDNFQEKLQKTPLAQELGWIGLQAKNGRVVEYSYASTTLEEIEYQLNRSAGYGLPIGLETTFDEMTQNALTDQILSRIALYEKLRLGNYFACKLDKTIGEKLQKPETLFVNRYELTKVDYLLIQNNRGKTGFQHRAYIEHLIESSPDTWSFVNPFKPQPIKLKIRALPAIAPFDDYTAGNNITLMLPTDSHLECEAYPKNNLGAAWLECARTYNAGVLELTIANPSRCPVNNGWVMLTKRLEDFLDLRNHKVIALEIAGANQEEVISVLLGAGRRGQYRQYSVRCNSTDLQYHQISLPATYTIFDHTEEIPQEYQKKSLRPFRYDQVISVSIFVKNINLDVGENLVIRIKSIAALQQTYPLLTNPKITLNGRTLEFPDISLIPTDNGNLNFGFWDYLDFNGATYSIRDGNNHIKPISGRDMILVEPGNIPYVERCENTITYHHDGENKALITIVMDESPKFWC